METAVFVPLDQGEISKSVIPLASAIADGMQSSLVFVHAMDAMGTTVDLVDMLKLRPEQRRASEIRAVSGPPGQAIARTVSGSRGSLVVMPMASRRERPAGGLGPVALEVLKGAAFPIVFVPPGGDWENWRPGRMLLPQDSTAECAAAIAPAIDLAKANHSNLTVLHVPSYSDVPMNRRSSSLPIPRYMDQPQHELRAWREEFIERLRGLGHVPEGMPLQLVLGMGEPAEEILNWSESLPADLIVLPWYRDYENADILKAVLEKAGCPVMVLPVTRPLTRLEQEPEAAA